MNEFIEKNRALLRFYCETLRTIASVILILSFLAVSAMTIITLLSKFGYWPTLKPFNMLMITWLPSYLKAIVCWIGILGLPQFIKYLVERDYKPGWILRHGDIFFYLYALLIILEAIWVYTTNYHPPSISDMGYITVISVVVKVMVLVGLGRILRYLMPVIEESKMLV